MPATKHLAIPSFTLLSWSVTLLVPTLLSACGEDAASDPTPGRGTVSAMGVPSSMGEQTMGADTMGAGVGGAMVGASGMTTTASTSTETPGTSGTTTTATTGSTAPTTSPSGTASSSGAGSGSTDGSETDVATPNMDSNSATGSDTTSDDGMPADDSGDGPMADDIASDDEVTADDTSASMDDMMTTDDMMSMDDTALDDAMMVDDVTTDDMIADDASSSDEPVVDEGPVFHIFMLMGQSNMVGEATAQQSDMNDDDRLKTLGGCNKPPMQWSTANPPLHDCNPNPIGPGDWFGKTMLTKLPEGHTIGLVPTAVRGESINTFISGGRHHQSILDKIDYAKNSENARFAGIIFHQGETDTGQDWWVERVVQLYDEVKAAFGVDYDVPFIAGELPADPGSCCSSHNPLVHQLPDALPMGYVVSQEGTSRVDQYHFDHDSVVLMGTRYGETMLDALGW